MEKESGSSFGGAFSPEDLARLSGVKIKEEPAIQEPQEKESNQEAEDKQLVQSLFELVHILSGDLSIQEQNHIRRLVKESHDRDVSYDAGRFINPYISRLSDLPLEKLDAIKELDVLRGEICKLGFVSSAKKWLLSTSPEQMRFGKATRDERIETARKLAQQADVSIEDIARELGIALE